jgi:gamma-glutamyltranspeptidase/glutathione hydrolase
LRIGILFTPDLQEKAPKPNNDTRPIDGFYRAGTDHRKDGQAAGW